MYLTNELDRLGKIFLRRKLHNIEYTLDELVYLKKQSFFGFLILDFEDWLSKRRYDKIVKLEEV